MDAPATLPAYAELCCLSNFSFLQGASHPEELVARAHELGYSALAITDDCTLAGVVRAHVAAKERGLPLLIGSRFEVDDPVHGRFALVLLATSREAYGHLCEFITRLRRRSPKGTYRLAPHDIDGAALPECLAIAMPARHAPQSACDAIARWLLQHFIGRCWLGVVQRRALDDELHLHRLRESGRLCAVPLVAVGDARLHRRSRKPLHDVLTATRVGRPLRDCGFELAESAEQRLRSRLLLSQRFPPELLAETLQVAARCRFSLDELRYQYPDEVVPPGHTPASWLRQLVREGMAWRWPEGVPPRWERQIEHELALITELRYEHYFLTVHDVVAFARRENILCQGRGSAANSVVCFCLGITEVNPGEMSMLFERFISRERREPPDIDVDFEHQRREEVIQYLYRKYGRDRAALTATVISYRPRSALRDVAKALGVDLGVIQALNKGVRWWEGEGIAPERLIEVGLDPASLQVRQLVELATELMGFPRHLSQHTGGFVLTRGPLTRLVPVQNAAMPDRTVIEWDKDDLDALGLLKVDVLALGMLTAIRKALELIGQRLGRPFGMPDVPREDAATYDMVCEADTVGVFQIESRAQMSMLPRLRPRRFYDLVIEVALVRPGPIQGGAVHPYLNRRQGKEPVVYPPALHDALERTLGVPVFQEQCMQIAMIAAGFTPDEADGLRRAMAAWKRKGNLGRYEQRLLQGMADRGYDPAFARGVVEQVKGFSSYGFPESHAASFAKLVYVSCWIKRHHPDVFLVALLNSQPLGFYTPNQLMQDARRHGVEVLPVDVSHSDWDAALAPPTQAAGPLRAVRLGLGLVDGLSAAAGQRIVAARSARAFDDVADLARRARLGRRELAQLAAADALASLSGHRRQQVWDAVALQAVPALLAEAPVHEAPLALPEAPEGEAVAWDYMSLGLTLRRHPLALLRPVLERRRLLSAADLQAAPDRRLVRCAGIVTLRQQPETASGVVFVSLEDETGVVQVIVWRRIRERFRQVLLHARLLAVYGHWQREGPVGNLIAGYLEDLTPLLGQLATGRSRDFH
ncbi:error-prone DNA polymerase [Hydrogenophaga crocea]|uniref:Error-prone DNA polymerase n=1 Tax=Hydrogenophaga crocea TaxID=2716225 RepID=A0A6G8IF72_9BURK|nr:error-prone DNA polymerase [Hydrogenophaga crocea]QIM51676.1 error-prone DNA polymerase [Hydrogenophaga crocea]